MEPLLIDHIGVLVPNLEEGIELWSRVLGYTFSPIVRYRTDRWADSSNPTPHHHDARICKSKEGPPFIEMMEFTGSGTHAASEAGLHHICIRGVEDLEGRICELATHGIRDNGRAIDEDGRVVLFFGEKNDFSGVRLEYARSGAHPVVADDGSALWQDPITGQRSFWGPPGQSGTD